MIGAYDIASLSPPVFGGKERGVVRVLLNEDKEQCVRESTQCVYLHVHCFCTCSWPEIQPIELPLLSSLSVYEIFLFNHWFMLTDVKLNT